MSATTLKSSPALRFAAPLETIRLWGLTLPILLLVGIVGLGAVLRFANLDMLGDGNMYYTAAVKSMLQSPTNFFFVAAEPGGSVTVDKPPVGLWLQALSAAVLGVNGFAVTLPQLIAGLLSIPLLYGLVKRWFGAEAGLLAALVLAITPVSIATERNNTMDATLIFTLLLAAWAFIRATETGKWRWLLAGVALVGIGFNMKMLQAYLPLPAFYGVYFLGAKIGWRHKIGQLIVATVVLLAVSFSWALIVDMTPPDQRPYIGSSETNRVFDLIIGYNGLQRLLGGQGGGQQPPQGQPPMGGGNPMGNETGTPGLLRLFTAPLVNEIGWLLPAGLAFVGLLGISTRFQLPLRREHQAVVLWGGWLVTEVVFFSRAGFFHAYYLAMIAPPLAAMVGIGLVQLVQRSRHLFWLSVWMLGSVALLVFQVFVAEQYLRHIWWLPLLVLLLIVGGLPLWLALSRRWRGVGALLFGSAILVTPFIWSVLTTFDMNHSAPLPHAYSGEAANSAPPRNNARVDTALIEYLDAQTVGMRYMVAVPSSIQGASYVLASGRGVLYVGGFNGSDVVVDTNDLAALVALGDLRYVLWGGNGAPFGRENSQRISAWLATECQRLSEWQSGVGTLYDCGGV